MKNYKSFIITSLFLLSSFLICIMFSGCGCRLEDIKLLSPEEICLRMNRVYDADFELVDYESTDLNDNKFTTVYLSCPKYPEKRIIAIQGYYESSEFGWFEKFETNYEYIRFEENVQRKGDLLFEEWLDGLNYKEVDATNPDSCIVDAKNYTFSDFLKFAYGINFYVAIEKLPEESDESLLERLNEKFEEIKKNKQYSFNIYFFSTTDIDSLTKNQLSQFESKNAFKVIY
ncbi:MAG: hypothetical protein K6E97_01700 [Treponema sp.]|nr:hypothetical protein [Treponema sp.]